MNTILPKGTVIGGLTIGKVLGSGGFGITYLAEETSTSKRFALKEYFPKDIASRQRNGLVVAKASEKTLFNIGLKAFLSEANILKTLPRQKGLVRVRGAFEKFGTAYCIMEYIEGDPLSRMIPRIIRRDGAVSEKLIIPLVMSVCHALAAVHSKKLIHRDVKPGNIMIKRDGETVLIDFGAARSYRKNANEVEMFTQKYAAIEQFPKELTKPLHANLKEGPWSDLFSLSVMLYEMVCRCAPPDAYARLGALKKMGRDPYLPVAEMIKQNQISEQYSQNLMKLIDNGCELFPDKRPKNAHKYKNILNVNVQQNFAKSGAEIGEVVNASHQTGIGGAAPKGIFTPPKNITFLIIVVLIAVAVVALSLWGYEPREVF